MSCRYPTRPGLDGLPGGEGVFLACSFWLANSLSLIGRRNDAIKLFERLLAVRNDLGLLSEEYDPRSGRLLGNFPQAFSHIEIINTAAHLSEIESASAVRGDPEETEHDGDSQYRGRRRGFDVRDRGKPAVAVGRGRDDRSPGAAQCA